jgi:hypothetical protein
MVWDITLKPRSYQVDAVQYALQHRQVTCCLPTGTGKTLVGLLWLKDLFEQGSITHAMVIEPTRPLVEQVSEFLLEKAGIEAVPIDGRTPQNQRVSLWGSPVIVCTGATAYNDLEYLQAQAIMVDECHHTVGQHAFAKLMEGYSFPYRLGLSATVPEKRRAQVEAAIGRIRSWSWSDPAIQPFVPNWIGELFESDLDDQETGVLAKIRTLPGARGLNPALLERYLVRDGAKALIETLRKENSLAVAYGMYYCPRFRSDCTSYLFCGKSSIATTSRKP